MISRSSQTLAMTTRRLQSAAYPVLRLQRSAYHSYHHATPSPFSLTSQSVLSAALQHVPEHGFTQDALRLGVRDAGYLTISTNLFPQGVFDLVLYYLTSRRLALHERVADRDSVRDTVVSKTTMSSGAQARSLILERLRMNGEANIIERWPQALAIMGQPAYIGQSVAELGRLADDIWFLAGDKSVDTSWYTKRASLCAIYAAAEMHQTQDKSPAYKDTEIFLDARLSEIQSAGNGVASIAEWLRFSGRSFLNVLHSKGLRL